MIKSIHNLPRRKKQFIIFFLDIILIDFALFFAYSLRLGTFFVPELSDIWLLLLAPIVAIPIFIRFGLFRAVIEYVEFHALWSITKAVSLYSLIMGMMILLTATSVPRSVVLINWLAAIILISGSRIAGRWLFSKRREGNSLFKPSNSRNVIIYGAGSSGVQIAKSLSVGNVMNPIAFVDDLVPLQKNIVSGVQVYSPDDLGMLIEKHHVSEVLLAMPSASRSRIQQIITELEGLPVQLRTLPGIAELAEGKVKVGDIRDVNIDDLLGREAVLPDKDLLTSNITNKVVMVTGAGGSIGSELCRQIVKLNPSMLILFEMSEYNLYALEKELVDKGFKCAAILGSVVEQARVEQVCKFFQVNTIYHAAAYKHVPLVETNPSVGVLNNVMGTLNAAKAAIAANVDNFVLISTDKAVRPTNIMGASKRFSELVLQGLNLQKQTQGFNTCFTMVRFGNVLGSSGSVVPYFRRQIKQGGPITVTHKDIIRYFMTIPEASQLVLQAGALGEGGDVFVLDMGEPVRIMDLAKHMIKLSGFDLKDDENPDGDIGIKITGLRPGEKLYEELLIGDNVLKTSHSRIMRAEEEVIQWNELELYIDELNFACRRHDSIRVREILMKAVKGYAPQCGIVDTLTVNLDAKTA